MRTIERRLFCEWHPILADRRSSWPVADARAEMRRTLEMGAKGCVVLTTHGEPEAAIVPFTTLEDMRCALLHLLVEGMGSSFARSQKSVRSQRQDVPTSTSSEEELEKLVGEVVRGRVGVTVSLLARCRAGKHAACC